MIVVDARLQTYLLGHVAQEDLLRSAYRRRAIVLDELVERIEWTRPDEVFVVAEKYLEMLNAVVEPFE